MPIEPAPVVKPAIVQKPVVKKVEAKTKKQID